MPVMPGAWQFEAHANGHQAQRDRLNMGKTGDQPNHGNYARRIGAALLARVGDRPVIAWL
jgi:hypothetical protein